MDSARIVAVVVPSPATSDVLDATSRTSWAPIFSYGSSSSISFATVTPSLVMVGLPNFLSRMTLRPLGPSVAFTAFANFSIPRSRVCRALSSNCSCLAAISFLLLRLSDDAEDVVLAHDQVILIVDFDFGAAVFRDQHLVALFHREIDFLSVFIDFSGAKRDHFPLLWFFLGGIGDDDPAFFCFLLFERLHQHPISEWFYVNCCHRLFFTPLFFWLKPPTVDSPTIAGKLFPVNKTSPRRVSDSSDLGLFSGTSESLGRHEAERRYSSNVAGLRILQRKQS